MDSMSELLDPLLKKEIKPASVIIIRENILATVTTHHHVIYSACIMQPWFSCHIVRSLPENDFNSKLAKPDPATPPRRIVCRCPGLVIVIAQVKYGKVYLVIY
jgi:hypothetical protein